MKIIPRFSKDALRVDRGRGWYSYPVFACEARSDKFMPDEPVSDRTFRVYGSGR